MGYMFRSLKPDDQYFPDWSEMRRRKRLRLMSFILCLPVTFVLMALLDFLLDSPLLVLSPVVVFGIFMWAHWRVLMWPCPQCRKPFYFSWLSYALVRDNCAHCDLPKYAPCDPK